MFLAIPWVERDLGFQQKPSVKNKEPVLPLRLQYAELDQILEILGRHTQNCARFSKFELNRLDIAASSKI